MSGAAEKRVRRAVEMARQSIEKPHMAVYLKRFHEAMDALETSDEGEAVYDRCRAQGWYQFATAALAACPPPEEEK